ncbi:MAG TPA: SDR family NAD(P)-dependent oxidoreductase [Candidatus Nanopelagicales bacterium]
MGLGSLPGAALGRVVDAVLEVSVVGSFGSTGAQLRRVTGRWSSLPRLDGRSVVITGATSGIGWAAAAAMRGLGAHLTIVGRDEARTATAAARLSSIGDTTDPVAIAVADLRSLRAARAFADRFAATHAHLDVLVHNAGALTAQYGRAPEGFEQTYAAQVLSPQLITATLLPLLRAADRGRVLTVSSGGMYTQALDPTGMQLDEAHYDGVRAYALAKRAQVVLTQEWARRFPEPVQFHAMHPGWADTPGVQASLPTFRRVTRPILRTAQEGADTLVWLAGVDPIPGSNGSFWLDRTPRGTERLPGTRSTPQERAALWDQVCAQAGLDAASLG